MKPRHSKIVAAITGVYDILHYGHLSVIKFARENCDYLIVGINSDRATKLLKGDSRPINNENYRKALLESVKYIDKVYIVDSINMVDFLTLHRPTIWCKGADYSLETINQEERKAVESYGGKIIFAPLIDNISTTIIIQKSNS
jgi:rfaE bifunctional protein nucleotidyltransferase chain/domain